mmetsp:Transcript_31242/g.82783  ORF Transcript_31242/g.82783 Transcript_31242/m.82783 type:complete len:535 (-) Transcript_31242:39-1643(-)
MRPSREAAVSDESNVLAEAGSHHDRGGVEHLLHARPALGPLVANDDDAPTQRLVISRHRRHHVLLGVEAARGALKAHPLLAGNLADRALRRKVALEDGDVTCGLDGGLERVDDVLPRHEAGQLGQILGNRLARDRHAVAVQVAVLQHVLEHRGRASNGVEVLHDVLAARLEVGDEGRRRREPLEVVERQVDAGGARHGDQVDRGVGRATGDHHKAHGVLEGLHRHDVARLDVVLDAVLQRDHRPPALLHLLLVQPARAAVDRRVPSRDRRRVRHRHPERLDRARHRVRCVHAAARARAGARAAHDGEPLLIRRLPRHVLAVRLERRDDVKLLVLVGAAASADRAAVHHHGGPVDARHGHDAAGHVFVAAGDGDVGVVELRAHHRLNPVRDQVARLQRVGHAIGAVRDAVADTDRVEAQPDHAGVLDEGLGDGGDVEQVHVARVALVPHRRDAHLRLGHAVLELADIRRVELRLPGTLRLALRDDGAVLVGCGQVFRVRRDRLKGSDARKAASRVGAQQAQRGRGRAGSRGRCMS